MNGKLVGMNAPRLVEKYVEFLKEQVDNGTLSVGEEFRELPLPPNVKHNSSYDDVRNRLIRVGMMERVSRRPLLFKINETFRDYKSADVWNLILEEAKERTGDTTPAPAIAEPEEFDVEIPISELLEHMSDENASEFFQAFLARQAAKVPDLIERESVLKVQLEHSEHEVDRKNNEIKDLRQQLATLREEVSHARLTHNAPRITERTILVEKDRFTPHSHQGSANGSTGGHRKGAIIIHRKPRIDNVPSTVKQRLIAGGN